MQKHYKCPSLSKQGYAPKPPLRSLACIPQTVLTSSPVFHLNSQFLFHLSQLPRGSFGLLTVQHEFFRLVDVSFQSSGEYERCNSREEGVWKQALIRPRQSIA